MKNNEPMLNQVTAVVETLKVALELCGDSSLMLEGVVTRALNSATALHDMMLDQAGLPTSTTGPEAAEEGEEDDFSWMDDMEAAGTAQARA